MSKDFSISQEDDFQEGLDNLDQPLSPEQADDFIENKEADREYDEKEKPEEKILEQPTAQAVPIAPISDEEKVDALKEAEKLRDIKFEGRKIEHLLGLAQGKGVAFAIEVAKKTDDACLLDLFHDKLVEKKLFPKS